MFDSSNVFSMQYLALNDKILSSLAHKSHVIRRKIRKAFVFLDFFLPFLLFIIIILRNTWNQYL